MANQWDDHDATLHGTTTASTLQSSPNVSFNGARVVPEEDVIPEPVLIEPKIKPSIQSNKSTTELAFHCEMERQSKHVFGSSNWIPVKIKTKEGALFLYEQLGGGYNDFLTMCLHLSNTEKLVNHGKHNQAFKKKNLECVVLKLGHRVVKKGIKTKLSYLNLKFPNREDADLFSRSIVSEQNNMKNKTGLKKDNLVSSKTAKEAEGRIQLVVHERAVNHMSTFEKRLNHLIMTNSKREAFHRIRNYGHYRECHKIQSGVINKSSDVANDVKLTSDLQNERSTIEKMHLGCALFDQIYRKKMASLFIMLSMKDQSSQLEDYLVNARICLTSAVDHSVALYSSHIKNARKAKLASLFRILWLKRQLDGFIKIQQTAERNHLAGVNLRIASKRICEWLRTKNRTCEGTIMSQWLGVARNESRRQNSIRLLYKKKEHRQIVNTLRTWGANVIGLMDRDSMFCCSLEGLFDKVTKKNKSFVFREIRNTGLRNLSNKTDKTIHTIITANTCIKNTLDVIPKEKGCQILNNVIKRHEHERRGEIFEMLKWKIKYWDRLTHSSNAIAIGYLETRIKKERQKRILLGLKAIKRLGLERSANRELYTNQVKNLAASKMQLVLDSLVHSMFRLAFKAFPMPKTTIMKDNVVVVEREVMNRETHNQMILTVASRLGMNKLIPVMKKVQQNQIEEAWWTMAFKLRNNFTPWDQDRNGRHGGKCVPFVKLKAGPRRKLKHGSDGIVWYEDLWKDVTAHQMDTYEGHHCQQHERVFGQGYASDQKNYRNELLGFTPLSSFFGHRMKSSLQSATIRRSYFDVVWLMKLFENDFEEDSKSQTTCSMAPSSTRSRCPMGSLGSSILSPHPSSFRFSGAMSPFHL